LTGDQANKKRGIDYGKANSNSMALHKKSPFEDLKRKKLSTLQLDLAGSVIVPPILLPSFDVTQQVPASFPSPQPTRRPH
jgi:hypothetical protein